MQNEIQLLLFFFSAEEKKQPNKFKSMHVQHDRRVVLEGCAIILWGRINLLSRRKWNKVAVTIRVSSHVQNKLNNCISLDVRHVQWHSFSSSEHCGFRSLLASPSVCFWLLQVFLQVLYQSPRVPFDAELCRFQTRHWGSTAVKWYRISSKIPEL